MKFLFKIVFLSQLAIHSSDSTEYGKLEYLKSDSSFEIISSGNRAISTASKDGKFTISIPAPIVFHDYVEIDPLCTLESHDSVFFLRELTVAGKINLYHDGVLYIQEGMLNFLKEWEISCENPKMQLKYISQEEMYILLEEIGLKIRK